MIAFLEMRFLQVAEYRRERIHFALADKIEHIKELCKRNTAESRQVLWEKVFTSCFLRVYDEVVEKVSRHGVGSSDRIVLEGVAPANSGSSTVVALVCSSNIIVSNYGDSRAVLSRGRESIRLSVVQEVKNPLFFFLQLCFKF